MRTRGIAIDELTPELQAQVHAQRQQGVALGPNSPLRRDVDAEADRSRSAARRKKSGAAFEHELEVVHHRYRELGRALIRRHNPTTHGTPAIVTRGGRVVRPGTMHYREGGAPCDFGGIASVAGKCRGVLFDAKVITGTATYAHKPEQYHQLEELRDHQVMRGIGFLLLADQTLGIAYLVQTLTPLLAREPILLRTAPHMGSTRVPIDAMTHHYPLVVRPPDFTAVGHYARWDWLTLLDHLYEAKR